MSRNRLADRLLDAPHRLCFAAAAVVWIASALAWSAYLAGLVHVDAPMQAWPPAAHALVFVLGAMPLFIAGFLFTAGPRWLRAPAVPATALAPSVALVVVGWLLVIGSAPLSRAVIAAGLLASAVGWSGLLARLLRLRASAPAGADRFHFDLAAAACTAFTVCLYAAAATTLGGSPATVRALAASGLWLGVVPVFVVASDRMLPFLDHGLPRALERRWPRAAFWIMATAVWSAGGAALWRLAGPVLAGPEFVAPVFLDWTLALVASVAAVASASLVVHWRRHRAARAPMVSMLLGALSWWTLAWFGFALARLPWLPAEWRTVAADAALHALTLGYLGITMLAMVTRISAAHSGRSIGVDRATRVLEGVLHLAAAGRVLAALWPAAALHGYRVAGIAWAVVAVAWGVRHVPWLLARRDSPVRVAVPTPSERPAGHPAAASDAQLDPAGARHAS